MARLEFAGARYVRNYHLAVPHHELEINKKKSFENPRLSKAGAGGGLGLDDNLIIHGDNLKALKSLLPHFAGKVKCIYIDPPYNTGNENWVYNDNVNSPRHKDWLNKVVDKDCQDRHDRWLSMMMPRLKLLRELLRDDGVIFISIDDNEVHRLRMLLDEIFGEERFVAQIEWQKRYTRSNNTDDFTSVIEHLLVYGKTELFSPNLMVRDAAADERYENPDNDPRGPWKSIPFLNPLSPKERPNLDYKIKNPNTGEIISPIKKAWRSEESVWKRLVEEDRVWWGMKGDSSTPNIKRFLTEVRQGMTPINFWSHEYAGNTDNANEELKQIFGSKVLDTPKPTLLIKRVIEHGADDDSIILDSFAGSGTTAHAVLALNKEDGGNRKFILVEQEDYADTITAERVRRVIKGVSGAKDENLKKGLGGSFTYVTLGAEYDVAKILSGKSLPKYEEMAAYVFQTATGETLDRKKIDKKSHFIGSSKFYDVYLFYEPNVEKLKSSECALKLDFVDNLPKNAKKKRLIFGAVRYVNQETLSKAEVEFSQLPYEVYRRIEDAA
jgi:adenine-specific DNA-methyltransferase